MRLPFSSSSQHEIALPLRFLVDENLLLDISDMAFRGTLGIPYPTLQSPGRFGMVWWIYLMRGRSRCRNSHRIILDVVENSLRYAPSWGVLEGVPWPGECDEIHLNVLHLVKIKCSPRQIILIQFNKFTWISNLICSPHQNYHGRDKRAQWGATRIMMKSEKNLDGCP